MNVEKRIERNNQIIELFKAGTSINDLAAQFDLDPIYVRNLIKLPIKNHHQRIKRNEKIRQMYAEGISVAEILSKTKLKSEQTVRAILRQQIHDKSIERAERNKQMVECAQNGETIDQIAEKFNLNKMTAYAILKSRGITLKRKVRVEDAAIVARNQEIKKLHESGMSHADISDKFQITRERVRQIAEKLGCQTRTELIHEKKDTINQVVKDIIFDKPTLSVSEIAREMKLNASEEAAARKSIFKERKALNAKRTEARLALIEASIVKLLKDNEELFILSGTYLTATVLQTWAKPRINYFFVMGKQYNIEYWKKRIWTNHPDLRRFIDRSGQRKLNHMKDLESPYHEIEE